MTTVGSEALQQPITGTQHLAGNFVYFSSYSGKWPTVIRRAVFIEKKNGEQDQIRSFFTHSVGLFLSRTFTLNVKVDRRRQ